MKGLEATKNSRKVFYRRRPQGEQVRVREASCNFKRAFNMMVREREAIIKSNTRVKCGVTSERASSVLALTRVSDQQTTCSSTIPTITAIGRSQHYHHGNKSYISGAANSHMYFRTKLVREAIC